MKLTYQQTDTTRLMDVRGGIKNALGMAIGMAIGTVNRTAVLIGRANMFPRINPQTQQKNKRRGEKMRKMRKKSER